MITGINSQIIFSVMSTDWETNFTDLETKITDFKLIEGALFSLSLTTSVSLSCFLSPVHSLAAHPFFWGCSATSAWLPDFLYLPRICSHLRLQSLLRHWPGIFRHFKALDHCQISFIFLAFSGILGRKLWALNHAKLPDFLYFPRNSRTQSLGFGSLPDFLYFLRFSGILGRSLWALGHARLSDFRYFPRILRHSCIFLGFLGRIRTATRCSGRKEKRDRSAIGWGDAGPV